MLTEKAIPLAQRNGVSLTINLGNLAPTSQSTKELAEYATKALALEHYRDFSVPLGDGSDYSRSKVSRVELHDRGAGRAWAARTKPRMREVFARFVTLHYLDQMACVYGVRMRLESHDHAVVREVRASNVPDLLREAAGLDDRKEVWLVL